MACFQKNKALARNADPTRTFASISFARERALATNADPRRLISLWDSVSCRQKHLPGTAMRDRSCASFFQNMFLPEDTEVRNADPRPPVFFPGNSLLTRKLQLGTLIRDG